MTRTDSPPASQLLPGRRLVVALVAGIAAAVLVGLGSLDLAPVVGWIVAAGTVLTLVWRTCWPLNGSGTKHLAEAEGGARSTDGALLIAAGVSVAADAWAIVRASGTQNLESMAAIFLAFIGVVLAWALVNTVFALRYARLYYVKDGGGIDFKQEAPPAYSDFAYMAFTVGTAFAVSDTEPTKTSVRRTILGHCLLSYAYGAGILGVAITLVTNLGQS